MDLSVALELRTQRGPVLWRRLDVSPTTIGAHPRCDICIPEHTQASVAAMLVFDGDGVRLRHLCGPSPLASSETRVEAGELPQEFRLAEGDPLQFGTLSMVVRFGAAPNAQPQVLEGTEAFESGAGSSKENDSGFEGAPLRRSPERGRGNTKALADEAATSPRQGLSEQLALYWLGQQGASAPETGGATAAAAEGSRAGGVGKHWLIDAVGLSLGTHETNDVVLDDPYVSSFHVRVSMCDGRCFVRDLGSRNGTYVDDHQVQYGEISRGSVLRIGQTTLRVAPLGSSSDSTDVSKQPSLGGSRHQHQGSQAPYPPLADNPLVTLERHLIGVAPSMERVRRLVLRAAPHSAPALIAGETGTGKDVVARMLHALGPRANKSWVVLNCGAFESGVVASELFGHERGAFTGAHAQKSGAFEAASGGTLFLDELGELPLALQPYLLRALETGCIRRVGGTQEIPTDVRLIAATHRDLAQEVAAGRFREDLYHRLNVLALTLPPLRQRPEDIPPLVQRLLAEFAPPGATLTINAAAMNKLIAHPWPGNVRELKNALHRAVLLRESDELGEDDILLTFTGVAAGTGAGAGAGAGAGLGAVAGLCVAAPLPAKTSADTSDLRSVERQAIASALQKAHGNRSKAARLLGISRSTIHRKIVELGLGSRAA